MNTGAIVQIVAAASGAISTPLWVWNDDKPTGTVLLWGPLRIKANINSFQLRINASTPAAISPGADTGIVM